jgi:hypothetical protein
MSSEHEHTGALLQYIGDNWPFLMAMMGVLSGGFMWIKRKVINDVYATKEEVQTGFSEAADERTKMKEDLTNKMDANHDEIKNLFIEHLGKGSK